MASKEMTQLRRHQQEEGCAKQLTFFLFSLLLAIMIFLIAAGSWGTLISVP